MASLKIGKLELSGWRSIILFVVSIIYWIAVSTQHLTVTNILINNIKTPWGKFIPRDYTMQTGNVLSVLIILFIIYRGITGTRRLITSAYWLFFIVLLPFTFRFLIISPIEVIHFPQYAILSFLLVLTVDPEKNKMPFASILFWVTLLGIMDETNQYFYFTRNYTQYYDFNDFFLNEVGASLGLLLYYGFGKFERTEIKLADITNSISFKTFAAIAIIFIGLMTAGILHISPDSKINTAFLSNKIYLEGAPGIFGSWQERDLGGYCYTFNPLQGTLVLLVYGFIISLYRYKINSFKFFRKGKEGNVQ